MRATALSSPLGRSHGLPRTSPVAWSCTAPATSVDGALASFVALSDDTFAHEAVLDAADYARRARALLG